MGNGENQEYRGWEILRRADGSYIAAISETVAFDNHGLGYARLRLIKKDIDAHQYWWNKLQESLRGNGEA